MNWNSIKEKYPKALHLLIESEFSDYTKIVRLSELDNCANDLYIEVDVGSSVYYIRDLFDFFDEQYIFIHILPSQVSLENRLEIQWFRYIINSKLEKITCELAYYPRKEAEHAAFEKAFEILENRLNLK